MTELEVAITATFTAQPLEDVLHFWRDELGLPAGLAFAPYNQVFQALLDPTSVLATNTGGLDVVLVRFEDLLPPGPGFEPQVRARVEELARAIRTSAERANIPHLVVVTAPSPRVAEAHAGFLEELEASLAAELEAGAPGAVHVVRHATLSRLYPVDDYADPGADELGHVPYTRLYFAALGTLIARHLHALRAPPKKVIALDCDQTLWTGVAGEDGPHGIELDAARRAFQAAVLEQHDAGKLLVLVSKNNPSDVWDVFAARSDLVLKREHLTSHRLDWRPKSENLRALARELSLGLDSFVLFDDNPVECAEVEAGCPEVLAIQVPADRARLSTFVQHVWALDQLRATAEDKVRAQLYRENAAREALRARVSSLEDFLAELQLEVSLAPLGPTSLTRAAQLTQRTNQFNATTVRRTEAELAKLTQSGELEAWTASVRDRFGDYGIVGLVAFARTPAALVVDTLLLSCRALGKGVEHRLLRALGERAQAEGRATVCVRWVGSGKNQPALDFLENVAGAHRREDGAALRFDVPSAHAAQLAYHPAKERRAEAERTGDLEHLEPAPETTPRPPARSALYARIATELSTPEEILGAVDARLQRHRPELTSRFVAPRTPIEEVLADLFARVLGVSRAGVLDNFFELGGSSLTAIRLISGVRAELGVELTVERFFAGPTVGGVAAVVRELAAQGPADSIAAELLQLEGLSDEDAEAWLQAELEGAPRPAPRGTSDLDPQALGGVSQGTGSTSARLPPGMSAPSTRPHATGPLRIDGALVPGARGTGDLTVPAARPIAAIGLITRDRPLALHRAITSYVANASTFGRTPDFVVADDSAAPEARAAARAMLRSLSERTGASTLRYAGREEKERYARRLVEAGAPEDAVRFALFDPEGAGYTVGANRNALILDQAGERLFITDDDTICRTSPSPDREGALALASGLDPADHTFFPDRSRALSAVPEEPRDLLAAHEALLGRDLGEIVRAHGGRLPELDRTSPGLRSRLLSSKGRALVTYNGIVGDCAWGAPFGVWGAPMGSLVLGGRSHDALVSSEAHYKMATTTREILRRVPVTTLSDAAYSMCTFVGLELEEALPPHFPVQRGQDVVFGTLVWRCFEHAFFGHVPLALAHEPTEVRRFWPGELFRTAESFDTPKFVLACISGFAPTPRTGVSPRERMIELGRFLADLARLAPRDLQRFVHERASSQTLAAAALLEERLAEHQGAPEVWVNDVRRYAELLRRSVARADHGVPLDLLPGRTPAEALALGQRIVSRFGRLLAAWPDLFDAAKALRREGHRLSVSVRTVADDGGR